MNVHNILFYTGPKLIYTPLTPTQDMYLILKYNNPFKNSSSYISDFTFKEAAPHINYQLQANLQL